MLQSIIYLIIIGEMMNIVINNTELNKVSELLNHPKNSTVGFQGRSIARTAELNFSKRPNLMLFSCNYGSGHKMASQAIKQSLSDYHVKVVDTYDEPLHSFDILRSISPSISSEKIVNALANKQCNGIINFMEKIGAKLLLWQTSKVEKLLKSYIVKHKPDMLISCIPLVNSMLNKVAKQLDLPLLVVTTDIDLTYFCHGLKDEELSGNKKDFQITVPYSAKTWKDKFGNGYSEKLENFFQYGFGYPTRKAFSESFDESRLNLIRDLYDIKKDENVVLIMMGGNSSQAAENYAKFMLEMTCNEVKQISGNTDGRNKIHLICLCGDVTKEDNKNLMTRLNELNFIKEKGNNLVRVQGFPNTDRIAELVSLPELRTVISKPGGGTVNEMIKKKMPMVYHMSSTLLDWEKGNMEYGEARNFGVRFQINGNTNSQMRTEFVKVLARTFALRNRMQNDPHCVTEAKIDFSATLRNTVKEMLVERSGRRITKLN